MKYEKIGPFILYQNPKNTLAEGYLFVMKIKFPSPLCNEERFLRVYLPSNYDFSNPKLKFPVLWMMDGQNLFDDYTSFIGEWKLDELVEERIKNGLSAFIIVGIDSPKEDLTRTKEMLMPSSFYSSFYPEYKDGIADAFLSYLLSTLFPLIQKYFHVKVEKEFTGIGGSSMGGLFSFYALLAKPQIFGFSLSYSPAFILFEETHYLETLSSYFKKKPNLGRISVAIGKKDALEQELFPLTQKTVDLINDYHSCSLDYFVYEEGEHNEFSWRQYLSNSISFWLDPK